MSLRRDFYSATESFVVNFTCLVTVLCVAWITSVGAYSAEPPKSRTRWAIIATDPSAESLADLLMVSLSNWGQIDLVDRSEVKLLLEELSLSNAGLMDSEQMSKIGKLNHADALLLIDVPSDDVPSDASSSDASSSDDVSSANVSSDDNQQTPGQEALKRATPSLRLRLVETRSSIRLIDLLLPVEPLQQEVQTAFDELKTAAEKLTFDDDQLKFVGLMSINSGEPGELLKPFCASLTTLVEAQLHRMPSIVVLERSDLDRLRSESKLSGLQLKIRTSARLLEIGVRRADGGQGMIATCRIHSLSGQEATTLTISTNSSDVSEMRSAIVDAVVQHLGAVRAATAAVDPEAEAKAFDQRRRWLEKAYRYKEAAEMAEAALALAPTADRIQAAIQDYEIYRHIFTNSGKRSPELPRLDELRFQRGQQSKRNRPPETNLSIVNDFFAYSRPRNGSGSDEDHRIFDDVRRDSEQALDALLHTAKENPTEFFDVLLDKLELLQKLCKTDKQFVEELPEIIDELIEVRKAADLPQDISRPSYARFVLILPSQVDHALRLARNQSRQSRNADDWGKRGLEQLNNRLNQGDNELALHVANLSHQSLYGSEQVNAAYQLLLLIKSWDVPKPPLTRVLSGLPRDREERRAYSRRLYIKTYEFTVNLSRNLIARCSRTQKLGELLELFLSEAESGRDASNLVNHVTTIDHLFVFANRNEKLKLAERTFAVLDLAKEDQVEIAESMRKRITKNLEDHRLLVRPAFSLDDAPGAWQSYAVRGIKLNNISKENNQLLWIDVDPRASAVSNDRQIVMGWTRKGEISIEQIGMSGGTPTKFGPNVPGMPQSFQPPIIAYGPDAIYVATKAPGFTIVRENRIERVTEEQGALSNSVLRMAWYRDQLYVAFRDALATYDPVTKAFHLLASSLSIEPKNPIDGRGSFFITSMIPDEKNGCLWMTIQDNAIPRDRNGFWRYLPEKNLFEKLSGSSVIQSHTDSQIFLHRSIQQVWAVVDKATGELTEPRNYFQESNSRGLVSYRFGVVGDDIVSDSGRLFTSDGQQAKLDPAVRFNHLQRLGRGLLTHYDERENTIWYIEPR